jgi:hypothetical protein
MRAASTSYPAALASRGAVVTGLAGRNAGPAGAADDGPGGRPPHQALSSKIATGQVGHVLHAYGVN